eukprot:gnl/MRDRNA2_/MRDRNA2_112575_c0_seq1.p1 gnl/MRDRNA2_/MRDRNA2_112575_c0~~gnl/MRDRNA2_/MRDRNA2_112575_c0_seq1.p1  ORF type:complete len:401 (+),score=70.78 gnl/MRDRNA2_/MRDRNA2_112575_c0_seq1:85-1287(+)
MLSLAPFRIAQSGCRQAAKCLRKQTIFFRISDTCLSCSSGVHLCTHSHSDHTRLKSDLPGLAPSPGEVLAQRGSMEDSELQVWHRLSPDIQASLLQPCPDESIGFKCWLGPDQSPKLKASDYHGRAGIFKLFTDAEAAALIELAGTEEGKHIPSKEELEKNYVGRYNTLRQAVKDRWLSGALWHRLLKNPGDLIKMEYWNHVVGANSELRLVRTQPPRGNEKAGQHLKHVDTREENKDFLDSSNLAHYTRVSIITVQCYLNPEEHEGGEFVVWPARLNLADPANKKETILYEKVPESNSELTGVKVAMKNGECVVFHQESDQLYHGGAPVTGDKDKVAIRFVLDMLKKDIDVANLADFYKEPEYGMGFTNDRSSIKVDRLGQGTASNSINCIERIRTVYQ